MVTSVVKGIVISKTLFYITVFINKKVLVNILNYIIFKGTLWEWKGLGRNLHILNEGLKRQNDPLLRGVNINYFIYTIYVSPN